MQNGVRGIPSDKGRSLAGVGIAADVMSTAMVTLLSLALVVSVSDPAIADLDPERATVAKLPAKPGAHWVWVNDMVFAGIADGKSKLFDADSGEMLGMLNTGMFFGRLTLPSHQREIYATESYFSRGTRGDRTDVLTVYDPSTLSPVDEIEIPAKKSTGITISAYYGITDNDRFALVYNFTPAQSVSVIDVEKRRLASEIDTAGCALVYPSGDRRFQMLCANGSMLTVELDKNGELESKSRSEPFFDPINDPVTEKAVRIGDTWLFVSFNGFVHSVDVAKRKPRFGKKWSLFTPKERTDSWKIGGIQHLAVHQESGRLYSLVHQGGADGHKDGGMDVWVYDLKKEKQVNRIALENFTTSIEVTQDASPLLFGAMIVSSTLDVYDAATGKHLRAIAEVGANPTVLQVP